MAKFTFDDWGAVGRVMHCSRGILTADLCPRRPADMCTTIAVSLPDFAYHNVQSWQKAIREVYDMDASQVLQVVIVGTKVKAYIGRRLVGVAHDKSFRATIIIWWDMLNKGEKLQ